MPKTFYLLKNRDAGNAFHKALIEAGYVETDIDHADMIFTDFERPIIRAVKDRPIFIYGHTPYSFYLYDGKQWLDPIPVACNFVCAEVGVMAMKSYGYPYRVEAVGFSRCEVKPFTPTKGKNLLYASAHLLGSKKVWPHPGDLEMHLRAMKWIAKNRGYFDRVIVNYSVSLEANALEKFTGIGIEFIELGEHSQLSAELAGRQFENIDLVISCNTFAYLALAKGVPTLMFGFEKDAPTLRSSTGGGRHYDLYKPYFDFPLALEEMSAEEVLDLRLAPNAQVEAWKKMNIGESFDAGKFISVVRDCL